MDEVATTTLKEEQVNYADYADFVDASTQVGNWLLVEYNTQRIHSAFDYATPIEVDSIVLKLAVPSA